MCMLQLKINVKVKIFNLQQVHYQTTFNRRVLTVMNVTNLSPRPKYPELGLGDKGN